MQDDKNVKSETQQVDSKASTTTEHCIKVWSEYSKKWRYIPKDPAYFRLKYYEYVGPKTCPVCGSVVQTQMCRHQRSQRCKLFNQGLTKAVEQQETAILTV
jgi:uncharacterized protein YijF (DUF1287 family)